MNEELRERIAQQQIFMFVSQYMKDLIEGNNEEENRRRV
jgi:hypothetical protein